MATQPVHHDEDNLPTQINTGGGTFVGEDVATGSDFIGRDKVVYGDEVYGDKVAGDKNVFVDSESLRWRFAILVASLMGLAVIIGVIWPKLTTVVERVTAPTPSPIPPTLTPTPTLALMTGDVNIAIARPQPLQASSAAQVAQFQEWTTEKLNDWLNNEFDKYGNESKIKLQVQVIPETIDNLAAMIHEADRIRADLLLYGLLDTATNPATYTPQFYIHPRFATGVSELAGSDVFGSPIEVTITAQGADTMAWKDDLSPRLADWAAFITGLGLYDTQAYTDALTVFKTLELKNWKNDPEKKDDPGKAVLYLWSGTTYMAKAQFDKARGIRSQAPPDCPIAAELPVHSTAECGLIYYEKARDLQSNYLRAWIGIGNYSLDFDVGLGCTRFDKASETYLQALQQTDQLTDAATKFAEAALVSLKLHYQIGLAHTRAIEETCGDLKQHAGRAIEHLKLAVSFYEQYKNQPQLLGSLARDLTSRAYFQMGLVYRSQRKEGDALQAFEAVKEVAQPTEQLRDPWQSIYWIALNQIGSIYVEQFQAGDNAKFNLARDALLAVSRAYPNEFGRNYDTEPFAASAAWFHLGRLYRAKAERVADKIDLSQLNEAQNAYRHSIEILDTIEQTDPKLIDRRRDGLPWISYLELGDIYRLWGKYEEALENYQVVMAAVDNGRVVGNNNLALAIYSRAALGSGQVFSTQLKYAEAAQHLEQAIKVGGKDSEVGQKATLLLAEINQQIDSK